MNSLKQQLREFIHYWKSSRFFREFVLFICSITASGFLAFFYLISGIVSSSDWFTSLAIYYGLLTLIRVYLCNRKWVVHHEKNPMNKDEISRKSMETTGILLALMNVSLSVMIGEMVFFGHSKTYFTLTLLYIIVYTFFRCFNAVRNALNARTRNRINRMIRVINLMDAMVAVFALTATLMDTLGIGGILRKPFLMAAGIMIVGALLIISDHMIMGAIREEGQ